MAYTRKTSDIITSIEFDFILEQIKDQSEVAKLLLKQRHSVEFLVDNHVNYISVSNSDPTKISYLTPERIEFLREKGEDFWESPRRFHIKPGAFVSKLFKSIHPMDVQIFSSLYKNVVSKTTTKFQVISGPQIRHYYHYQSYSKEHGSLGSSCMKYDQCQNYLDIYVKNPQLIKMLVVLDQHDKLIGRALLWDDGFNKIMDRIYTIDDDNYQFMIKTWADENGYLYKKEQRWNNTLYFESKGKVEFKKVEFQLDKFSFGYYPYMDTFKFIDLNTGKIYNYQPEGVNFKTICSTDGEVQPQNIYSLCDKSNMYFTSDSIVPVPNRGWNVSSDYTVYSDIYDTYILRDDAFYDQDLGDWIYEDNDLNNEILLKQKREVVKVSNVWDNLYDENYIEI
jgi:hypothetical protein